ncbi:MAG: hypothetical protein JOZ00_06185 [Mycobacterium sp.]|uniref:hypothetical protein n=1 Tax=Mycobacterium sp. TaxID=1785 RepID=UPI001ED6C408|nr:hypothetical protein [Mycobacterium sp.]MBV8786263.1 hypothetical protein [Mycobacterium sp.]
MVSDDHDATRVDALVEAVGPKLHGPPTQRSDVVLVTGPWMAGVTAVATALSERLQQHKFVESTELGVGDVPMAVVFVVSAASHLTESDCALLDAAAEYTDAVVGVVSKIDVHLNWRDIVAANREKLAAHAPRYGQVPWVGAAALPDLGEPDIDELVKTISEELGDSALERRNVLRAWEFQLQTAVREFDRDVEGAGRQARVDALRHERSTALQQRREAKTERTVTLRGQIQQARVQLSYFARNRCSSLRTELQEDAAALARRNMAAFEADTRGRLDDVVAEVRDGADTQLADVAQVMGVSVELPPAQMLPTVEVKAPPLKSRQQETWLMMLLGAGFGLGVALTLSRLLSGVASRLSPALAVAATVACVVIGLVVTFIVINIRGLLRDRALLDRWAGEVTSSLQSVTEELVATRVLAAESVLTKAVMAQDATENAQVTDQVAVIDNELREHAMAAKRAAATQDREMPAVLAALDAVRTELGEPGTPTGSTAEDPSEGEAADEMEKPAPRSEDSGLS